MNLNYWLFLFLTIHVSFPNSVAQGNPEIVVYKTVDTINLRLYYYFPEKIRKGEKYPAIIFFFGGGWTNGSNTHFESQAEYLSECGIIGITADYRIKSIHNTSPQAAIEDAKSAIRWVRQHAEDFHVNPEMIGAGGGSAGGHLAACTALVPGFERDGEDLSISSEPNVLVLFNPVVDVGPFEERFGGPEQVRQASPIYFIDEKSPPTVIFHGASDELIDKDTILEYQEIMIENGRYCEVVLFGAEKHGFFNQNRSEGRYFKRTLALMEIFLKEQGYIR